MCVLFIAWRVRDEVPLVVAANRDEAYQRPTAAAAPWSDCAGVIAGRDLEAGGTWMGVGPDGRWAAVTNVRNPEWMSRKMPRSRGRLVADYLCHHRPPGEHVRRVAREREHYGGFNLLVGDLGSLYYVNRDDPHPALLAPGFYGLSNARLDEPWPKVANGGRAFQEWIAGDLDPDEGLSLLRDTQTAPDEMLPDTGVGLDLERVLSPLFISGQEYGTRSSTLLVVRDDGSGWLVERSYGPGGEPQGSVRYDIEASPGEDGQPADTQARRR